MRGINLLIFLVAAMASPAFAKPVTPRIFTPKIMVITMFAPETRPWLEREPVTQRIAIPGLHKDFPTLACSTEGLCIMTTGMGFANAASSVSALIYSRTFDLRRTYFLIAGIAGVDPKDGTLGSAHWARYVIDGTLRHEIDPRQIPADWPNGVLGLGANKPGEKPTHMAGTEVYRLNEALLQKAYGISRDIPLADAPEAVAYRTHYEGAIATGKPFVSICDTESSDLFWHGSMIGDEMQAWSALLTDDAANYCTSQMEDNATLTALNRAATAGLVDFQRVLVLRTASNFDREGKDQTPAASLAARSGGYPIALENAYRVGAAVTHHIIQHWPQWR